MIMILDKQKAPHSSVPRGGIFPATVEITHPKIYSIDL